MATTTATTTMNILNILQTKKFESNAENVVKARVRVLRDLVARSVSE